MTTEFTAPRGPELAADEHLLVPLLEHAADAPDRPLFAYRDGDGFVDVAAKEVLDRVRLLARGLIALGVAPGDRVALMSHTRVEWALLDLAILAAGGVTVPIFETSSAEQVEWILRDSGAVVAIVETREMRTTFDVLRPLVPACRSMLVVDEGGMGQLEQLAMDVSDGEIDERIARLGPTDLATIIYTSGTTGRPKGCVLTHGNLRANMRQVEMVWGPSMRPDDRSLLFLPLAHSFAKILLLFPLHIGQTVAFATDQQHAVEELPMAGPSWVASVPRVFEKVFNGARAKAADDGKAAIFDRAADVAIRYSEQVEAGSVSVGTRLLHALFDRLVYGKIRALFGVSFRFAASGGGPLGARLTHFFNGVGIQVYEGYGLTETSPVLSANRPGAWRIGTVGRPVPGTSFRIAADGEILARGPQVFSGYWQNEARTAETFTEDGWFKTGDLGSLDDDGYLRITGRKKDLIITSGGKNVAPSVLEDRLRAHPLVSQAMVVGDGRPFIAALITIDEEEYARWAGTNGLGDRPLSAVSDDPRVRSAVQEAVDAANLAVSRAESIRSFAILPQDFTIETGDLTPTLKVKRDVVSARETEAIERLYTG